MDETRQIKAVFNFYLFHKVVVFCAQQPFLSYFNYQIVSSKTFFRFVSPNSVGLFFYSVIAYLSVPVVPVWKAAVAMEMVEWPFAVGWILRTELKRKTLHSNSLFYFSSSLSMLTKGANEAQKKSLSLIPTPFQTFVTLAWIKWLFALSDLYHLTGSTSLSHSYCPMEIKITL